MTRELGPILRSLSRRKSVFALVVAELASGFTVISCLMMACSFYLHLGDQTSGHNERDLVQVMVARVAPASDPELARTAGLAQLERDLTGLRQLPGVKAAAQVSQTMLDLRWTFPNRVTVDGGRPGEPGTRPAFAWTVMGSPDLPRVIDLQPIDGVVPAVLAAAGGEPQVVITRCLRDRLFKPGERVVGRRLLFDNVPPSRVAAVVEDVMVRMPFIHGGECVSFHLAPLPDEREVLYLVRTDPERRDAVVAAARGLFGPPGPTLKVTALAFDSPAGLHHHFARGLVIILSIMGTTVGILALLGALAVSSFMVAERTRQIGIRRALGATRGDVIRYFLVENALATLLGTLVGLVMTGCLYLAMRKVFPGIQLDPKLLLLTGGLLWIDATLAAMIPARRAAEIPPSVASRAASAA